MGLKDGCVTHKLCDLGKLPNVGWPQLFYL